MIQRVLGRHSRAFALLVGNVAAGIAGVLLAVVVSRALGDDGKGTLATAVLVALLCAMVAEMGVPGAVTYFVRSRAVTRSVGQYLLLWWCVGGVALVAVLAAGIAPLLNEYGRVAIPTGLTAASGAALFVASTCRQALLSDGQQARFNIGVQCETWLPLFAVLYVITSESQVSPSEVLGAQLLGWTAAAVASFVMVRWSPRRPSDASEVRSVVRFGLTSHAGTIVQYINYRLDALLAAFLAGPAAAGVYSVATTLAETLWRIPRLVALVAFPRFSGLDDASAALEAGKLVRLLLLFSLVASGVLATLAVLFTQAVFGADFGAAILPLLVLMPGVIVAGNQLVLVEFLRATGRPEAKLRGALTGAVVTVCAGFFLIGRYGAVGAAIASSLSYAVSSGVIVAAFRRHAPHVNLLSPSELVGDVRMLISRETGK